MRFALNQGSRKNCSGGVTCPGLIHCVGLEQFQGRSKKFYKVPDLSLSFILNFEVSDQSFKGEVHLNHFDYKKSKLACGFVTVACHIML